MSDEENLSFGPVATFAAIARTLTESLELPEVLRRIANEVRALTDATGVSILLRRDDHVEFVAHASPPPGSLIPVGFRFQPGAELVAALSNRTEPLIISDLHASPLIPEVVKERIFVRDVIIFPLRVNGRLIGVLNVAYNEFPEEWPFDLKLLGALADQAAVAVRNAQLYEAARDSSEQLVRAEKLSALGRLVARITHELNNPLTTARLLAESLDMEPLPYVAMEQVRALSREVEHAAAVVKGLLLFVHNGQIQATELCFADLAPAVVSDLERRLTAAGVQVRLELPSELPVVRADPHGVRQVLSNLLQNSAHALSGVADERRIVVRARAEEAERTWLVVEVEDNGPGIPEELLGRIFEPFFTTKPIGEGTGLGLAIIREIVEAHGGTIEIANAPMGGAISRFRLPAEWGAPVPARGAAAGEAPKRETPRGLRVLIIDDEVELQRALRRVLLYLGCEVTTALTGEEGLAYAKGERFDLILCDMKIPGLHGTELYDRLKLQAPHAIDAVVFMTGDSVSQEIRDFIAGTGRPSLTKPFGRAQLEELLTNQSAGSTA